MTWIVEFTKEATRQALSLDVSIQKRIRDAIDTKLAVNPDFYLKPLVGDKAGFYKFRVGDYRLLCSKDGKRLVVTVVKLAHRREVYH
jgi:mRNA interferase RelE/StbE